MNATTPRSIQAPDLTRRAPRSPRVRLGGYTILPRVLDKARAAANGQPGAYKFGNPLDGLLFTFAGITAEEFMAEVERGRDDAEMLEWLRGRAPRTPAEIAGWAAWTETYTESGVDGRRWLADEVSRLDARRDDVHTIFDYLDLEDYVSFR